MGTVEQAAATAAQSAAREPASPRWLSVVGGALGLGAPLGFLVLRHVVAGHRRPRGWLRRELSRERLAYGYMGVATPAVFAAFGGRLAVQQRQLHASFVQMDRMREEFAAVVAHDLRNPIHSIRIQTEYLLGRVEDGQVTAPAQLIEGIHRAADRLSHMVSDLLDASRIEASRLSLAPAPIELPGAVRSLLDRVRPTLKGHPVEVQVEDSPPPVHADPVRLDQILTNLIDNAARYSPPAAPITVVVRPEGGGATVSVQDRGPGIPPDRLATLFERFHREGRQGGGPEQGLGLGLYIAKGLVDAHGGRLRVATQPGQGSTFSVWLPAAA